MRLLEYEGKALFARHGIAVPKGALWPEMQAGEALVVKAQVPAGGRGKGGGVAFAASAGEARAAAEALLGKTIGDHVVERVWIEERLDIARELYLAVTVDRDARCRVVLASPDGGIDIEAVADERVLRTPLDPLAGMTPTTAEQIARFLDAPGDAADSLAATVAALHRLALAEDAELAEINPLAITRDGAVVAADAKVTLDARARFRHDDWDAYAGAGGGSEIERTLATAGGVAVEIDPEGDVIAIVSGAGLMMATLDLMVERGLSVRCVIDMGGTPLGGAEGLAPIFRAVAAMRPRVTFINAYFHTALADSFARGILGAAGQEPIDGRVVLRLRGRNAVEGRALLAPLGFDGHDDLTGALDAVAAAVRG